MKRKEGGPPATGSHEIDGAKRPILDDPQHLVDHWKRQKKLCDAKQRRLLKKGSSVQPSSSGKIKIATRIGHLLWKLSSVK